MRFVKRKHLKSSKNTFRILILTYCDIAKLLSISIHFFLSVCVWSYAFQPVQTYPRKGITNWTSSVREITSWLKM